MQIKFNECNTAYVTFYKWDYGQILEFDSVPDNSEVHFPVKDSQNAVVVKVVNNQCEIPKSTLTLDMSSFDAWLYVDNGTSGKTKKRIHFTLIQRAKPDSHIYNPNDEQMLNYNNKLDKFQGKENEGKTFIVDSEGNANLSDLQEITIDTELSKESNNAIANSAVAKVLLGGKLLKTILVKSDEEVEKLLTDLTENFAELTPVLMICGYDATENFGVGIGAGCIFLDSGDGDIENAIQALYTPCEIPFTTSMAESLKKCVSFVDENYNRTVWRKLSERSDGSITYSTFADGTGFNSIYPRYIKMDVTFVGEFLRVGIGTSRTTTLFEKTEFNEALSEDEAAFVHLEIEPGNDFWLCTVTYYGNVGTRTITKTIPLYSIYKYHISSLYLSAGGYSSNNVEVKNGYARNDGNGYLG